MPRFTQIILSPFKRKRNVCEPSDGTAPESTKTTWFSKRRRVRQSAFNDTPFAPSPHTSPPTRTSMCLSLVEISPLGTLEYPYGLESPACDHRCQEGVLDAGPLLLCNEPSAASENHQANNGALVSPLHLPTTRHSPRLATTSGTPLLEHTPRTLESDFPITPQQRGNALDPVIETLAKELVAAGPGSPDSDYHDNVPVYPKGLAIRVCSRPLASSDRNAVPVRSSRHHQTRDERCESDLVFSYPAFPPNLPPQAFVPPYGPHLAFGGIKFYPSSQIGSGSFGTVWHAFTNQGQEVAIKLLHKPMILSNGLSGNGTGIQSEMEFVENEWLALKRITEAGSPFLTSVLYSFEDDENIYFVQRLYPSSLGARIRDSASVPVQLFQIRIWAAEIVLAIEDLHNLGIVHRDIKLDNVLLSPNGHAALGDLGLACIAADGMSLKDMVMRSSCGTPHSMAPEMFARGPEDPAYGYKTDMWAFGVLLLELCLRLPHWSDCPFSGMGGTPDPRNCIICVGDPYAKDLISDLLQEDPTKRPGWDEVKRHAFFRSLNWREVAARSIPTICVPHLGSQRSPRHRLEGFVEKIKAEGRFNVDELYELTKTVMPTTKRWDFQCPLELLADPQHGKSCIALGDGRCVYEGSQFPHHETH
ncbi:kinase-like protein [Coniophora puteana RWD-64-598 SS2]|uniref:non-specific serine/threonine protein kinase n=1 Tax=Coniophora puteana (strain RWD-64-598) TaxID=741705 RepID=A0A5M3N4E7_CONPW|nr:kinase-like protein [Coniophora puteana RWD-64-598 SS2]EIW85715.1 kinase-like protein [Coniophora puteana RWD-64-598 SS2]